MGIATGALRYTPEESPRQTLSLLQQRLDTTGDKLNLLCPAGVGDLFWIIGKLWRVCMERDVVFWLPGGEQKRGGDVFRMAGLPYGYLQDLTTEWIWSQPGSPPIPHGGATLSIQPNRHLEHGHRIEKWYPEYEFHNPIDFMDIGAQTARRTDVGVNYVVGFMSQTGYMEYGGNLKPAQWARIWQMVEDQIGPVVLIGAAKDIEFAQEVMKFWDPSVEPVFNAPLDQVARLVSGAKCMIGAHAGPLIMATYMGIPTLHAYPRWLAPMPGTWECEDNIWAACFLDELETRLKDQLIYNGREDMGRMRMEAQARIVFCPTVHPRWTEHRKALPCSTTAPSKNGAESITSGTPTIPVP